MSRSSRHERKTGISRAYYTQWDTLPPEQVEAPVSDETPHPHHKARTLRERVVGLRSRIKWPGWSFIILGILTWIPDWKSRLDFWVDIAHSSGTGLIGMGATIIASPYFSPALIAIGLGYLALVGEPKRGVQRHPWWPYIGWIAFVLCATAMFVTTVVGYVQLSIQRQVGFQIDVLQKRVLGSQIFWHLPEYNKTLLGAALDKIDEKDRFDVPFKCLSSNSSSISYMTDIYEVFTAHHWKMNGNCLFSNVKADLLGVWISVPKDANKVEDLSPNAKKLADILTASEIQFGFGRDEIAKDQLFLVVGNGPFPNP
jgi:hypothetical protein